MATGLLTNQIGYDPRHPIRAVFRADSPERLGADASWALTDAGGARVADGRWHAYGNQWGASWWTLECEAPAVEGAYTLSTTDSTGRRWTRTIDVLEQPYFRRTVEHVAIGQFERRAAIPTVGGKGWIDCGGHLSEANSHAVSVFGMCHLYRRRGDRLSPGQRERLLAQIRHGSRYFLFLAEEAGRRGLPAGTYQHEPIGPDAWILQDSLQIGIALCLAEPILRERGETELADALQANAWENYRFIVDNLDSVVPRMMAALPAMPEGAGIDLLTFSPRAHALDDPIAIPEGWMTREWLLWLHFQMLLQRCTGTDLSAGQFHAAEQALQRWRPRAETGEPVSCFVEFAGLDQPEVAWCHHSVGRDTGGVFPHFVLPLQELAEAHPDHPLADTLRAVVREFFDTYVKAAFEASPFGLLPSTWKHRQGWLFFAGLWHGMNASYALMAMQAFALAEQWDAPWLRAFAKAQLDWIAGLNAGYTDTANRGCVMSTYDVPPGEAVPVSMIYGIGREFAGSWRTIRGSISNGFSRGKQFNFDVAPDPAEDRPDAFTDEDWITHAGAWMAALAWCDL